MSDFLIKEVSISDGDGVKRVDISPPIEFRSTDKLRMVTLPGSIGLQVDWYRGWASGRRSVYVDMPNPGCAKDTVSFIVGDL